MNSEPQEIRVRTSAVRVCPSPSPSNRRSPFGKGKVNKKQVLVLLPVSALRKPR